MSKPLRSLRLGLVGATGLVGETFLQLLTDRSTSIQELRLYASESSTGQTRSCQGKSYPVYPLSKGCFKGLDLVFFSAGDDISLQWAPLAQEDGAFAVDNSAAFRMSPEHLLIVPEVNGHLLKNARPQIIANPNCSTIQLVVATKPLLKLGLKKVKVATYQAVSGAGRPALKEMADQLEAMRSGQELSAHVFPHVIAGNCIPQIGSFDASGFCSEETKIINETKKILGTPDLKVSAFTVRIPAENAHSEAVWFEFASPVAKSDIEQALKEMTGLSYVAQQNPSDYPTARMASGKNEVYIGRLHQDKDDPTTWLSWIVADNLKKGAALNGLQIAELLF